MSFAPLKTSTALVATLSLLLPHPTLVPTAWAQEAELLCRDDSEPPCPEGEPQGGSTPAERAEYAAMKSAEEAAAAEAEAQATRAVSDAIAQSGSQAINSFIAQEYTKAVAKFATSPNAKTILFPVEATQLIGSLGGIGELVREVVKPGDVTTPAPDQAGVALPHQRSRSAVPRTGGEA